MSVGITQDDCVSTPVRTLLGRTIALVHLDSAWPMMGSTVKVLDCFSFLLRQSALEEEEGL